MNDRTQQLLTDAKADLARGEQFYRSAAEKIVAAMAADPTLSTREVARQLGHDHSWVGRLVTWHTSGAYTHQTPFAEEPGKVAKRHADSVARNDPPAIVTAIEKAPPEQRREIIERIYRSSELEDDLGFVAAKTTRDVHAENDQRHKDRAPEAHRLRSLLDAQAQVSRMDYAGLKALRFLEEVNDDEVEELDRELLLWRLRRIGATCEWMIERLTTGARSIDTELAELLNEEV
jgi:hypothetical protein